MQERARIVLLLAAEAMASRAVALKLGCMRGMVSKWSGALRSGSHVRARRERGPRRRAETRAGA